MMRIVFIVLLFFSSTLLAQNGMSVVVGANYSTFRGTDKAEALLGFSAGINYQWDVYKTFSISSGLLYTQKGGNLKKVTIRPAFINPNVVGFYDIYYYDIKAQINFLETPFHLGYTHKITNNQHIKMIIGASIFFALSDNSREEQKGYAFKWIKNDSPEPNFDLIRIPGETLFASNDFNYSFDIGISYVIASYKIKLLYHYTLNTFGPIRSIISIDHKISSLQLGIGIVFR